MGLGWYLLLAQLVCFVFVNSVVCVIESINQSNLEDIARVVSKATNQ